MLYSLIVSMVIIIIGIIVNLLILKNMDKLYSIFGDNEFICDFLRNIAEENIKLPVEMIVFFFIFIGLINYLIINKKILVIILDIILFFVYIISIFLLSKSNDVYIYQIILNLMEALKSWRKNKYYTY